VVGNSPLDPTIEASEMITPRARFEWERWKTAIQLGQTSKEISGDIVQDTVGAIVCTIDGDVSAGVSRSGLLLSIVSFLSPTFQILVVGYSLNLSDE
jgi:isoaspartyl peptidase/L-asparaginase-like protein (Ntn-hydrolase superfamily)